MTNYVIELYNMDPYGKELYKKMLELATMAGVEDQFRAILDRIIRMVMKRIGLKLREKVAPKHMRECLKRVVKDMFDDIWPEIENEIFNILREQLDELDPYMVDKNEKCCCLSACWRRISGLFLYIMYPCKLF